MFDEMTAPDLTLKEKLAELLATWIWKFRKPTFAILMGGPGAGKGTVARKAAPLTGLAHISTGDLIRHEIAKGTEIGRYAQKLAPKGKFVSDEIVLYLLRKEICRLKNWRGAILDGYPRSEVQAQLFEQLLWDWSLEIPLAIMIEVSEEDLIERLGGRLTCSNKDCGRTFHVKFDPPSEKGICDSCGSTLHRREDDNPATIPERLRMFKKKTAPLVSFYEDQDKLVVIQSTNSGGSDHVLEQVLEALARKRSS